MPAEFRWGIERLQFETFATKIAVNNDIIINHELIASSSKDMKQRGDESRTHRCYDG
jgi:hypothetical protein